MAKRVKLLGLLEVLSEELQDVTTRDAAHKAAISRFTSRMRKRADLGDSRLSSKAVTNFIRINSLMHDNTCNLDPFIEHNARLFITEAFERYNKRFDPDLIQVSYDHRHLERFWRFGPGSSNGVVGTHTAEKITQPMTCTLLAKPLVEKLRRSNFYFFTHDMRNGNDGCVVVQGSRLTTVPKNEETERTIAIEPSGNMALQLALGEYITEVLRSIGLDIRCQQPKNKELAWIGSLLGEFATIDMSNASDMFTISLVRRLMPPGVFDTMMRIRSPYTELPDGTRMELEMMSTMGNGFTFPMMTFIFTALVYATRLKRGGKCKYIDWSQTAVFGDDIIVPTEEAEDLIEVLTSCGFIVNTDKSYLSGPFRESCGGDYYAGVDITPPYVRSLDTDPQIYVALNKIMEWCAKTNTLLPRTLTFLLNALDREVLFVPEWCGNDAGFRTPLVQRRYKYLSPTMPQFKTKCPEFDMMLACGGYTNAVGPDSFYTPRPFKTRYKVRRSRLPRGFLDGADPFSRSASVSRYVESYHWLLTQ